MVGRTLAEIHERLQTLATPNGPYYLACARTGDRPTPSGDRRYPDRATAATAADLVDAYRDELRTYDPRLPHYDVIVRELPADTDVPPAAGPPTTDRTEFCHEVAAAVFESLSGGGFRDAERAVMDAYLGTAETVTDPDDLCLLLLRSMGAVLDETLDAHEQEVVLNRAAGRLDTVRLGDDALDDALDALARAGLLTDYHIDAPRPTGDASGPPEDASRPAATDHVVRLDGYALSEGNHVLTLPVAVELLRRRPGVDVQFSPIAGPAAGFRVAVADRARHEPCGLLRVPGR
ncbi:DUF7551 domain-containing protein [Halocalculus aciditolerans]|uniref:Uncharacterized protein n=1 Tax=Halocalculus aciditolerans TaxID=1383812 RepID=A0A830FNH6_9EURY|nr:hypothetical protein [Halocalculus aciditolerans]GGL70565.1 hypothetical protein GCM10009039_30760 [Halocalculus aciditolerans]